METLDTLVTYAYDLTLGGGAFYIGTSLMLHLAKRWNALEPRSEAVRIPLALPEGQALELEIPAPTTELLRATLPEFQSPKSEPMASVRRQETE
jgi:hypothetical protein